MFFKKLLSVVLSIFVGIAKVIRTSRSRESVRSGGSGRQQTEAMKVVSIVKEEGVHSGLCSIMIMCVCFMCGE